MPVQQLFREIRELGYTGSHQPVPSPAARCRGGAGEENEIDVLRLLGLMKAMSMRVNVLRTDKLKRLISQGILVETEPGLSAQPRPQPS
ncbi:hypothetical protein [Nonomuraea sp. NPDC049625]|uniref:hypothetical protein n=1 Tax=Nonomuraea sp. NPDC049625 TaxID=3155775 RepID=UPI003437B275